MNSLKDLEVEKRLDFEDAVVHAVLHMPHKILSYHEVDDLAHLVLHDLCHENHFGLNKAVYLVDNPEFNCLKGVAGYCKDECSMHGQDIWEKAHSFSNDMRAASFHDSVKQFLQHTSLRRQGKDSHDQVDLDELGHKLGMKNPASFTWNMRHGNHGIFLFEEGQSLCSRRRDLLQHASKLLSLC